MTVTTTETAVRYERDADGIVTLTLDDPTSSANTMTELTLLLQDLCDRHLMKLMTFDNEPCWKLRSKTYEGIAAAMAEQWGTITERVAA